MLRQDLRHSAWGAILSAVVAIGLIGLATAQDTQPPQPAAPNAQAGGQQPPASQPASQPDTDEDMRILLELARQAEEQKQREEAGEPPPTAPGSQPAGHVVTPRGERPAVDPDDDFFGPPYPPATPRELLTENGVATQPVVPVPRPDEMQRSREVEMRPAKPVSHATDDEEWFNFDDMPWEDVIQYFADRIGKPLMTDMDMLAIGGTLTYHSDYKFTKDEAIDELNLIMQMRGFRFVEEEHHIYVVLLSEMPWHVKESQIFGSRQEFEKATARPMDFVTVFVTVTGHPAARVQSMFELMVSEGLTISALDDTNQLKMTGPVREIRKVLDLMDRIAIKEGDPRKVKIFNVKTNASEVERIVRELLEVSSGPQMQLQRDPRTGRMIPVTTGGGDDRDIRIVADERTNTIIAKAIPSKLEEIQDLIDKVDAKPDIGEFKTEVIVIENANASDVADLLNKIFSQEQGSTATTPAWQRLRQLQQRGSSRTRRTTRTPTQAQTSPEDILAEGTFERAKKTIRLAADERTNSLIVYANAEGQKRVRELLETIDKVQPSNFQTIKLEQADAAQVFPTISQIVQNIGAGGRGRGASIVLDEANNQFHIIAEREAMQQIEEVIAELDVATPEGLRHMVQLQNIAPSRVAEVITPVLMSGGTTRSMTPTRGRFNRMRGATPAAVSTEVQIIPLDEAQTLIVVCSDEDWTKVEEIIQVLDEGVVSNKPRLETIDLQFGDAMSIASLLNNMYRGQYVHPALGRSAVLIQADGSTVLLYAIKPAIDEIKPLIEALDREDSSRYEILPLAHADATQVATEAMQLFGGVMSGRRPGRAVGGSGGAIIQAESVTNSLIVQADTATLEKIKAYAQERDEAVGAQLPEQRFFTLRFAQSREVASAVQAMYGSGSRKGGRPVGPQIKAVASGPQVVIEAPKDVMPEISAFIAQLDDPKGSEIIIRTVKLEGADVAQIASKLGNAFRSRNNVVARFDADTQAETIVVTCSKDVQEEIDRLIADYAEAQKGTEPRIEFRQMNYAQATEAANWLREQLVTYMQGILGRQAASKIKVTADARTNRVVINGPDVAVKQGLLLLDQYDIEPVKQPEPVIVNKTIKLVGLDVRKLASNLNSIFSKEPPRPDRLRATFSYDETTEMLIVSAPKDMFDRINEVITSFEKETADLALEQEFVKIVNADAAHVGNQLRQILVAQSARTRTVADRISITVEPRLNEVVLNVPKFVMPMAKALIAQLDQPPVAGSRLRTISLVKADANAVAGVLNNIFNEKIRAKTLQITAEPLTNSLIVGGGDEDFHEIEKWAMDLESRVDPHRGEMKIVELKTADPYEVLNILNSQYVPRRVGQRNQLGQEISFNVTGGRSIVVQAPPDRMTDILAIIEQLDAVAPADLKIQVYELKVLNAAQVAGQVQAYLSSVLPAPARGQMRPGAFPEPTTNTLLVIAPPDHMPFIDRLINGFESQKMPESDARTYVLKNSRAEQVAQSVDTMLKARIAQSEGQLARQIQAQTAVLADMVGNRLFVMAPEEYQKLAEELINMVDQEVESGDIVHIIALEKADAVQMGQSLNTVVAGMGRSAGSPGARSGAATVRITADAASNSIILAGMPEDMAKVEKWIEELESKSEVIPELQIFQLRNSSAYDVADTLGQLFPSGGRGAAMDKVTITPDESANRLLITANKRKMRQIEAFVAQLDAEIDMGDGLTDPNGRELFFVEVLRGSAFDLAWDVRQMFPPEDKGGPVIEADWFGEYIKVRCRPNEYDRIVAAIRKHERWIHPEHVARIRKLTGDTEAAVAYLRERMGGDTLDVQYMPAPTQRKTIVEPLWEDDEPLPWEQEENSAPERTPRRERQDKPQRSSSGKDVQPFKLGLPVSVALLGDDFEEALFDDQPPTTQPAGRRPSPPTAKPATAQEPPKREPPAAGQEPPLEKEQTRIVIQPDNTAIIYGPKEDVDEVEDVLDMLEEDMDLGEVIRIFQFKYGDVAAAAEVVQIMFNDRQTLRLPQQMQQMQQMQQQMQQMMQRGRGDQQGRDQGGMMDQFRGMVGGRQSGGRSGRTTSGERVRIATDPGHNYLIIKCQESDLPEIKQLLRELDIPPGKVEIKVFQLYNLDAQETAGNIREVLGINKVQQRRGSSAPRTNRRGGNAQQQLLEMLQQQTVAVAGVEGGAKVESVEIVANAVTNSLMVSAPPEVMQLIEEVITELEQLEGRDVVGIYHYELLNAKRVDDVLPLLQEVFAAATSGGGGRGGRGSAGSPGSLGPVTISGDPRTNTIIFTAEAKDVEKVLDQIQRLDIEGAIAEAETYACKYGDASAIADVVSSIYAGGTTGRPGRGGGGNTSVASQDLRIVAEPTSNVIVVFGTPDKRAIVLEKIEELDLGDKRDIREIDVIYANPEELADKLLEMFGGTGAATSSRRGPRGSSGSTGGSLVIIGDKNSKKLLVRAPDPTFLQIEDVVATLDQPNEGMQLRRFAVQYADPESLVATLQDALMQFVQMNSFSGRGGGRSMELGFDPFTVVPDTRTKSIIVVGSQQTFAFVESVLATIDVETPADMRRDFRVFVLDKADAEVVAEAINSYASGGSSESAGSMRRGGGRGMMSMMGGGTSMSARELDVQATADVSTNAVMVFGRSDDIDFVAEKVIDMYEESIQFQIATIPVENVKPTEIASFIWQFIDQREQSGGSSRGRGSGGRGAAGESTGPQMVPFDNNQTLVVRGTPRDIEEIRGLVERFDHPDVISPNIAVIKVPLGQDVERLATNVERIVNESEEQDAERTGRTARRVSVEPELYTNTLMVGGDQILFGRVQMVVDQLAAVKADRQVTRVIQLRGRSAQDVQNLINELQQRRGSSGGSRSTPTRSGGSSRRSRGRGDATWPNMRETRESLWPAPTPAGLAPYVSVTMLQPSVGAALVGQWLSDDSEDDPPQAGPKPRPRGTTPARPQRPRAGADKQPKAQPAPVRTTPVKATPKPAAEEPVTDAPQTQPVVEGITGISGELRGDVIVTAIDDHQVILSGDETDIDFIEQILIMMEATAPQALVEVFYVNNAKATALAPVIETAIKARIDVTGIDEQFSINAEGRSNALIVAASETIMEQIAELIEKLDLDPTDRTDFRCVPLQHVRASEAVAKLRPIIEKLNDQREVPKESQATIEADDRSNSVFVVGTLQDVADIERMLEAYDVEIKDDEARASFVRADAMLIQLQNGQATDIAKVLTDMIEAEQDAAREASSGGDRAAKPYVSVIKLRMPDGRELPELDLERPIRIVAEEGTNSLIIFSTPKNNEALTEIVQVFDTLPIGAETELRAISLQYASAEDVASLLEEVFKDKSPLMRPSEGDSQGFKEGVLPPVPPGVTGKGLPYNVVVQHDVRSNTVIVIGRQDAVLLAAGLIAELDKPTQELGMRAYVIELKNIPATSLQEKLSDLLEQRTQALGGKNESRDNAVIIPDDRSNRLVVFATRDVYDMIEELAMELDAPDPYRVVATRYRRLGHADAQKLAGLLEELFDRKKDAEKEQSSEAKDVLSVIADARSNSLILTGTRDYLAEAEALIDNLDQQFDPTVVMKVRPIKLNSAANIATLLQDLVDTALKEQDSNLKGTPIHIASDPLSESLLMAASAEDMVNLDRWVDLLDRPNELGRMMKIVPLRRGSAEDVAKAAETIFKNVGDNDVDVSVTSDPSTNSVVAFGPPALVAEIADFARRLDDTDPGTGAIVRIFKLEQTDAESASDVLSNILEGRGGSVGGSSGGSSGRSTQANEKQVMLLFQRENPGEGLETLKAMRGDVTVIGDLRTNSLVIIAPPESMPLMESLVAVIDVPPDAARIRIFALKNADAEETVNMLNELFERRTAGQSGGSRSGSDESERELTLGGGAGGGREEVSFTTDMRTNSVIAAGTPGYLDLVEQLILQLDTVPMVDRKTIVYPPRNMVAADLATAVKDWSDQEQQRLDELGEDISLAVRQESEVGAIAYEASNRIILSYSPRREEEILRMVRELDQCPPQVSIEVLIVEVSMGNSLELGVEFAFQDLQYVKAGLDDTTTFDYVGGTDVGAAGAGLGGFTFTITGRDFNFLLHTLQSENSLNVLSRPHIVAMDNQPASISVTDSVPYVTGTQTTTGGQISTSVQRSDVGIKLEVTPQINPDGYVRLEIRQEVSDLSDSTIAVGQGLTAPIFNERVAETVVTVQDNETVVLGGLIQTRESKTEQKVPLVGDLPLLGPLFRFQTDDHKRSELLVILTPRVVRTVEDYRELSIEARDHAGIIPDKVKTDPLMRGLRVRPEELMPVDGGELLGPYRSGEPTDQGTEEEQYGPLPPVRLEPRDLGLRYDPNSYDVPMSLFASKD
ncbi:MAG: secretin N-terminal domain-containing protein [Phycisphaerae bacterium]|jgi:type II secretion system protein D